MQKKITYLTGAILSITAFALISVGVVNAQEDMEQNNETENAVSMDAATISTGQTISTAEMTPGSVPVTISYTQSSDSTESGPMVKTWVPKTAEEKKYYSYVGTEKLKVQASGGSTIKVANSVQGPLCQKVFESVLEDYSIARTYNIFPGVYNLNNPVYELDSEVEMSLDIPKTLQREGRTFEMICVSNGKPYVLEDLDASVSSITIKTKYFYAYALCYKDK